MSMCQCPSCGNVFYQSEPYNQHRLTTLLQKAEFIIDLCCNEMEVKRVDVIGKTRKKEVAKARHLSQYFIYTYCEYSYEVISGLFGRDHTTVMSACERVRNSRFTKTDVYGKLIALEPMVKALFAPEEPKSLLKTA